jgi:hypothetical protein
MELVSLEDFVKHVCSSLGYKERESGVLKAKANEFFQQESFFTLKALIQTVTQSMLESAHLRVLWPYVKELQGPPELTERKQLVRRKALQEMLRITFEKSWIDQGFNVKDLRLDQHCSWIDCLFCDFGFDLLDFEGVASHQKHHSDKQGMASPSEVNGGVISGKKKSSPAKKRGRPVGHVEEKGLKKKPTRERKGVKGDLEKLPASLPRLVARFCKDSDPSIVFYSCQWSNEHGEVEYRKEVSVVDLATAYGDSIVDSVMDYDEANLVNFQIDHLQQSRASADDGVTEYLVRWLGYPHEVFDTWQSEETLGNVADALIKELHKKRQ